MRCKHSLSQIEKIVDRAVRRALRAELDRRSFPTSEERWLTRSRYSKFSGMSPFTVQRKIVRGLLRTRKLGGQLQVFVEPEQSSEPGWAPAQGSVVGADGPADE